MSQANSQEHTIYRNLESRIQLGFYQDGERFPSAKEIAEKYQVSYCPAQRALKMLERDGLIKLCRGKETLVLAKPFGDYLNSQVFRRRIAALIDLCQALKLISTSVCLQGLGNMGAAADWEQLAKGGSQNSWGKKLYRQFELSLRASGNQMLMSLYYDMGAFIESAFLDILYEVLGGGAGMFLERLTQSFCACLQACQNRRYTLGKQRLEEMADLLFGKILTYLHKVQKSVDPSIQESFQWEPHKGRTKYCDVIAIDLVCKINQGIYPEGTLLPTGGILADIYHVSAITIRRTIGLLNQLGIAKTFNGIGTRVISRGDAAMPYRLKSLGIDSNLKQFLEALQLVAFTGEEVLRHTLPCCSEDKTEAIAHALGIQKQKASMVAFISACLQAIVHCCPLAAVREIYSKITLQLLNGSVLRLAEYGDEEVPQWTAISSNLRECLVRKEYQCFASGFRKLVEQHFAITKQQLLAMGVKGVENIADLVN